MQNSRISGLDKLSPPRPGRAPPRRISGSEEELDCFVARAPRNDGGNAPPKYGRRVLTRLPQERRGWPGPEPGHDELRGHLTWKALQRPKSMPSPASTDPPRPALRPPPRPAPARNHNGSRPV